MFTVRLDEEPTYPFPLRAAVDDERGVLVRWVRGYRNQSHLLRLMWGRRVIPFEALPMLDPETEQPRGWHIARIGTVLHRADGGTYDFADADERRAAQRLAAEAMLLFGTGDFNAEQSTRAVWTASYNSDGETVQLWTGDVYPADHTADEAN